MEDTTTNATGQEMTADEKLRKALATQVNAAKGRYEDELTAFLAAAQSDPVDAIARRTEDLAKAQVRHEVWVTIERELAEHDPREVLAENLNDCRNRVLAFLRGRHSNDMVAAAVDHAQVVALARQVELLEELTKRFKA